MYEKYIVLERTYNNESGTDIIVKKREKQANVNDTVFMLTNQENGFFLNLFLRHFFLWIMVPDLTHGCCMFMILFRVKKFLIHCIRIPLV